MVKKTKTSRYNRKRTKSRVGTDKQLEGLSYHYRDIQWFWQFLKLAVDYEGKVLNVRGRLVWEGGHKRKGHKFRQGRSLLKGTGGSQPMAQKRVMKGGKNYSIKITDWKQFGAGLTNTGIPSQSIR